MATREVAGTARAGVGSPAIMAALAVLGSLLITIAVAAAIVFSPAPAAGTFTLSERDDWGTRHQAVTAPLGQQDDYGLRHAASGAGR